MRDLVPPKHQTYASTWWKKREKKENKKVKEET